MTLVVVTIRMAFDEGGFFPAAYLEGGELLFAVLAVVLFVRTPRFVASSRALVALGALAIFTAWTAMSATWSLSAHDAIEAAERDLVYTGVFALALIGVGSGRHARIIVWLALSTIVIIVGSSLLSRLYPDLVHGMPPQIFGVTVYRLSYPLGYWNALGGLGAMGAVLALGLAADLRTPLILRGLSAGSSVVLATATYLTLSRGAAIAAFLGVVGLLVLTVRRGSLLATLAVVASGIAISVARLQHFPQLTTSPRLHPGQLAAGHTFGRELVLIVVIVAFLNGLIAVRRGSHRIRDLVASHRGPLFVVCAAAVIATVAIGIANTAAVNHAASSTGSYIVRQWSNFWSPANNVVPPSGLARYSSTSGSRGQLYRVAFAEFKADPLTGDGAGSFKIRWTRKRPTYESVQNAHSLEIETLGEEGLIGLGLLLLFLGIVAFSAFTARVRPWGLGRGEAAAVSAAFLVWLIHSAFDWDWQVTAMTSLAFVLAATLLPSRGVERIA